MNSNLQLSRRALQEACEAWERGGTMSLGLWLSRFKPRFNAAEYGDLVAMVRAELDDDIDYSKGT